MNGLKQRTWPAMAIIALGLSIAAPESSAIPTFSRKYQTSCATCHEAFPRLNAVGEAFRSNGYKFENDELYIKDEPVEMGDEAYKRVFPDAIWPSDIPGLPPLSILIKQDFKIDIGGTKNSRTEATFPDELELLFGGALGDNLSFWSEIEIEGGAVDASGSLQFEDLLLDENMLNLVIGNLGRDTFGLYTARDHRRLTKEHYDYSSWQMPYPAGFTATNDYRIRGSLPGLEINGFGRNWRYAAGVTDGDGATSDKDFFGQVACKIGGLGFDGSGAATSDTLPSAATTDDSLIVSAFAHSGQRSIEDPSSVKSDDNFWRAGVGVLWKYDKMELGGGYILGNNDNPYGTFNTEDVDSAAWFVEGSCFVYPWLIPTVRYEVLNLDIPTAVLADDQDTARVIASVRALIRSNIALTLEGRFYTNLDTTADTNDNDQVAMRLEYGF